METADIARILINALLVTAIYTGFKLAGLLEGRTPAQRLIRLVPAWIVALLILNLVWPG